MTETKKPSISRRHFTGGVAAGVALLSMPAVLRSAAAQTGKEPLKIGVLLPKSGVQAGLGQACQRGADVAQAVLDDLNYGVKIELLNADTESNVDTARTQAEKLINGGAAVLTGAFDSGQSAAIAQVAEQRGIPYVINIAADPKITEQGYKFVFRNFPTAPMLITGAFDLQKQLFAATGKTPKTAVLMSVNDAFGTAMMGGIKAMFPKFEMPYEIVDVIAYDPRAKDLSVEVAKAKATKADILMPVSRLNDAILLVQEMVKQRWEPMGIVNPGAPGMYEQQFYKTLGKYSEFCVSNVPWLNPRSKMTPVLAKRFKEKFPNDLLELNVGFTFEAILIAADAYKRTKSAHPNALVEALRSTKIDDHVMVGGPIQFDGKHQNVNIKSAAVQNLKRQPTVVLPADSAAAKPVFPMPGWNAKARA
jgi:branched-chain amino acid transport system substrate-binding protein